MNREGCQANFQGDIPSYQMRRERAKLFWRRKVLEERTGATALWQIKSQLLEKKEVELLEDVLKENRTLRQAK